MKYFAVIDTNVLVSAALKPNSNPGTIFRLIEGEVVVPLINDEILDEYTKVCHARNLVSQKTLFPTSLNQFRKMRLRLLKIILIFNYPMKRTECFTKL